MRPSRVEINLLFYYSRIMFNKFNQQGQRTSSRGANHSLKAKSKLTVFMVYKMIQKRKEMENSSKITPAIYDHLITENLFIRDSFPDNLSLIKQQPAHHSEHRRRDEAIHSATYGKRKRCQTELQANSTDAILAKRQNNMMTSKSAATEQSSEINKLIIQKLKKVVGKGDKKKEKFIKLQDFGLNITQIKRLEMPLKRQTLKQRYNASKHFIALQQDCKSELYDLNSLHHKRIIHAKRSLIKEKLQSKELPISSEEDKEGIQSIKFQSLDHSSFNKNLSGKKIGKQTNNYAYKLHKMFDCLDLILNSYHCFLNQTDIIRTEDKNQSPSSSQNEIRIKSRVINNKYYFFIGRGNNSNLIRSILRKRSWWAETNSVSKANLVWTQLKIPEIISKVKFYEDNWESDFFPFEEEVELTEQASPLRTSCKKSSATDNTESPKVKDSSLALIFHEKQDKRYYSILRPKDLPIRLQKIETPELMHNHYQQNFMFGNKNALYYNISMYYDFIGKELSKIVPSTYYLEKSNSKSLLEFEKVYAEMKKKSMIWIVKPAENSNRGQGIIVTSSLNEIKTCLNLHKKVIVQSYIKNLLLYNGRKFDIRTYMLATTIHGRLKVFWYDEGYIRTSSQHYDLTNLFDSYIHLTNDAIQKTGDNYGKYEEGNKLSYSEFQRYLQMRFPKENLHINEMHDQMKELARDAVRSIYCRIDKAKRQFAFELFGLDFIIDSNFKPILIEINTNPCLELSSPILERLIPRMTENIFRLCIDPIFRPKIECSYSKSQSYYIYDESFLQRNKFSLIFDEKYDRDFEWEQRCKKMRGIEWGEGEEQEYDNQGSLIVVDY